jgi:RNA polymerase sigma factor (sigma-70 family)
VRPASAAHDPETLAITGERSKLLRRALRKLPAQEKLLLRLRFDEEMTLDQIAKLLQFGNAQRVDRQIKQILPRCARNWIVTDSVRAEKSFFVRESRLRARAVSKKN